MDHLDRDIEVRIERAQYSVITLIKLCSKMEEFKFDPLFVRDKEWEKSYSSELIESMLLGIPTPPIYLFETQDGKKEVVDGRQRITTILDFVNCKFKLGELMIFKELTGLTFLELEPRMQGIFEDYIISFYIIQPPTPKWVMYDILRRVSQGGTLNKNRDDK